MSYLARPDKYVGILVLHKNFLIIVWLNGDRSHHSRYRTKAFTAGSWIWIQRDPKFFAVRIQIRIRIRVQVKFFFPNNWTTLNIKNLNSCSVFFILNFDDPEPYNCGKVQYLSFQKCRIWIRIQKKMPKSRIRKKKFQIQNTIVTISVDLRTPTSNPYIQVRHDRLSYLSSLPTDSV